MKVIFVGAGPGDPELLTLKAARLLRDCRCCIYAGSLVSPEVIALLPEDAEKHNSAGMTLEETIAVILRARETDTDVIRLHTGDPSIYGAIREQMDELDKHGILYEVVPGVSSFQAAAAAVATELTAPEVSQTVILTRVAGRTPVPAGQELENMARTRSTLCLFLSITDIEKIAKDLAPHYGDDCPVAVVFRASWPDELVLRGMLADIASKVTGAGVSRTAMILVGRALERGGAVSKLYDPKFTHGYRTGKES